MDHRDGLWAPGSPQTLGEQIEPGVQPAVKTLMAVKVTAQVQPAGQPLGKSASAESGALLWGQASILITTIRDQEGLSLWPSSELQQVISGEQDPHQPVCQSVQSFRWTG